MPASLLPLGILQFADANGDPLVGGTVGFYLVGSPGVLNPVWADAAQTTPLANPVPLDAAGRPFSGGSEVSIYGVGSYQMTVRDVSGNIQWTSTTTSFVATDASGNVTVPANLGVPGVSNLNTVNVAGNLTVGSPTATVVIGGSLTAQNLSVPGTTNFTNLNLSGNLVAGNPAGASSINGNLTVGSLGVVTQANLNGVAVAGFIQMAPGGIIQSSAGTSGNVNFASTINAGQNITCAGAVEVSGNAPGSGTGTAYLVPGVTGTGSTAWSAPVSVAAGYAMSASGFFTTSDERAKQEIRDITPGEARRWVMAARPRRWWDLDTGLPGAGFVAQEEIERGRTDSVRFKPDKAERFQEGTFKGYKLTKDYNHDIGYLTAVLQQMVLEVEELRDRVELLEAGPEGSEVGGLDEGC